ncbi:hypothetical protein EJB05_09230, partial [Eragrostis curvula]
MSIRVTVSCFSPLAFTAESSRWKKSSSSPATDLPHHSPAGESSRSNAATTFSRGDVQLVQLGLPRRELLLAHVVGDGRDEACHQVDVLRRREQRLAAAEHGHGAADAGQHGVAEEGLGAELQVLVREVGGSVWMPEVEDREMVTSALAQETLSQILSRLVQKHEENHESSANRNLERLEMAPIRLEAALETSYKWQISDASLLRWRKKLKRATQERDDTLHKCKQRVQEDENIEQEVRNSSLSNRIAHATKLRITDTRRRAPYPYPIRRDTGYGAIRL